MFTKAEMREEIAAQAEQGNGHYVYALHRGDTNEIFYIGKGQNGRVFSHGGSDKTNSRKMVIIEEHGIGGYSLLAAFETSEEAFDHEARLIEEIGLADLSNICPGGGDFNAEFCSAHATALWEDPEMRAKMVAGLHRAFADPGVRERQRESMREYASTERGREKLSYAGKAAWGTEERRQAGVERSRKLWEDPEYRAARVAEIRAHAQSPGNRERRRTQMIERMADPATREVISKVQKEIGNRPEERARRKERMHAKWATQEHREKAIAAMKAKCEDPEHLEVKRRAALEVASRPGESERRSVRAKKQMTDSEAKRKVHEGRKRQAAIIREHRKAYCAEFGITSPGKNYCNVDKAHFEQWVKERK